MLTGFLKFILALFICIIFSSSFSCYSHIEAAEDPIAREVLDIVLSRQPVPYGLPGSSFHYHWAQFMMSVVAAEQNGYIMRTEAIDRLSGLLSIITQLDKYHGFVYDDYNPVTLNPTTTRVNFQGWYLYSLIVLKNTYPELAATCQGLLDQIDYYSSGMYSPSNKSLVQAYYAGSGPTFYWSLADYPASEIRIGYLVYTYLTGDRSPWLLNREPSLETVAGYSLLNVWHTFNFDPVLIHNQLPEYGYYRKSWNDLLDATAVYMDDNGMVLFPIRHEPLHYWAGRPAWPNTEHRESMPWLTWYFNADAPVMSKAFIPGYGISRYYDNWNFYWTYGTNLSLHPNKIGTASGVSNGHFIFPFFVYPSEEAVNPPVLKLVSFTASYNAGKMPNGELIIELNGNRIGEVSPAALSTSPMPVVLNGLNAPLFRGGNYLVLKNADPRDGFTYNLYRYENDYRFVKYRYPAVNGVITYMDTLDDLEPMAAEDARAILYYVAGYDGANAIAMAYDFERGGDWAQVGKDCSDIDISGGNAIQFYYRASGDVAGFEVKLEDIDGTTYGYRFNSIDYNLPWRSVSIPYSDFSYYWGGADGILDTRHIKEIWFTAIKVADGTAGNISIDNVTINGNLGVNTVLVPGAVMEVIVDGQRAGEENCMAFLSRVAVAHDYHAYAHLLNDPAFMGSLVAWVGNYNNNVSLAPYIHNLSGGTVTVSYERPADWKKDSSIRITDITANTDVTYTATFGAGIINWPALSNHTYKIEHLTGGVSGRVTLQGRADQTSLIDFELREPGETAPIDIYQVTVAADGSYLLTGIEPGTYDLTAKGMNSLRAKQPNITVAASQQTSGINFSLLGGDADNNNVVSLVDFAILRAANGTRPGDPKWDPRADFNGNNQIDLTDFAILRSNSGKSGAQ